MEHATPTVLHAGSELDWEINVSAHIFSILQNEAAKLPKNPPRTPTLEVMSKVLWSMCILATAYRWLPPAAAAWRQGGPRELVMCLAADRRTTGGRLAGLFWLAGLLLLTQWPWCALLLTAGAAPD